MAANPNDIFLFEGEPNPADIKLRAVPASVEGHAEGQIIIVQASIISGVATGVTKTKGVGGGVSLLTPSFPIRLPKKKKKKREGHAGGAVIGVTVEIIPGVARGYKQNEEDFPELPLGHVTPEEFQNQLRAATAFVAMQDILRREDEKDARDFGLKIAIGLAYAIRLQQERAAAAERERQAQERKRKQILAARNRARQIPRKRPARGSGITVGHFKFKL